MHDGGSHWARGEGRGGGGSLYTRTRRALENPSLGTVLSACDVQGVVALAGHFAGLARLPGESSNRAADALGGRASACRWQVSAPRTLPARVAAARFLERACRAVLARCARGRWTLRSCFARLALLIQLRNICPPRVD
eukprot:3404970-Rhodomonas_salina.2